MFHPLIIIGARIFERRFTETPTWRSDLGSDFGRMLLMNILMSWMICAYMWFLIFFTRIF